MQFRPFESGIEVNGQTVFSVVDGLGKFKTLAKKFLLEVGIGSVVDNEFELDLNGWYSHESWLKAFEKIAREVGDNTLFQIGLAIPRNAKFPPWVNNVENAVKSIDIAYHMNHRKDGVELFDQKTGKITEGIGHYGFEPMQDKKLIISECQNPYPCKFDEGIITAMARRFEPTASVVHDNGKPCRKNGAESCTYIVTW